MISCSTGRFCLHASWGLFVALLAAIVPRAAGAQIDFPASARIALDVFPERAAQQHVVDRAFGLQYFMDLYAAPQQLGARAERFTLYALRVARGWTYMGVTGAGGRVAADFEELRGSRVGTAGSHDLHTYRRGAVSGGAAARLALIGRRAIAEGTEEALRVGLQVQGSGPDVQARLQLERGLRALDDPGGAATLVYMAPPEGSTLSEVVADLGALWGSQLTRAVEPYESVLALLGTMRAARADVWQMESDLGVRIVLVAEDAGAAKRAHFTLRTARGLVPMASKAAVRAGSMSAADAEVVADVLQSMQSHVEDDRIHVTLHVPEAAVQ